MSDLRCPAHPDADLIEDHRAGDVVCPQCGLVVGDRVVDVSSEWRSFNNEKSCKDPSRVGAPENNLLSGGDLSTSIVATADGVGADLSSRQNKQTNGADRRLIAAFGVIREMADRIHLPKVILDQANAWYKQVADIKSLRGRNTEAVAAACLYIACRKEGVPRTFKEICAVTKVNKKEIGRCFKLVVSSIEKDIGYVTSSDFMSRFCGNLTLPRYVEVTATHIARKAVDLGLVSGRSPVSVAAAAIYMACQATLNDKREARDIGEIAGAAEVTIKQSYKLMIIRAKELFPQDYRYPDYIASLPPA